MTPYRYAQIKDIAIEMLYKIKKLEDSGEILPSEVRVLGRELVKLHTERGICIPYPQIKSMEKGESVVYFIGTTEEAHNEANEQQMGVVKEAIRMGIATASQRIVKRTIKKTDTGVDMVNIYAYSVIRI